MNSIVNFEIAKLLKEKDYNGTCSNEYSPLGVLLYNRKTNIYPPAPIIADVVMWLYEKHKLFITLYPYDEFREDIFSFLIIKRSGNYVDSFPYFSPTEAYLAAIKYCLETLI